MSENPVVKPQAKPPKIFIAWHNILLKKQIATGEKLNQLQTAKKYGITTNTLKNWDKEAPPVVGFIFQFMKDNNCTFDDLVKLVETSETENHE